MGISGTAAAAAAGTAAEAAAGTAAAAAPTILGLSIPTFTALASGVSALAGLGGSFISSSAASSAARATAEQNAVTLRGQNEAFNQRIQAGLAQTAAQLAASRETAGARNQNFTQMRQAQIDAQQRQQDILDAENRAAAANRQTGDTQAQQLLSATDQQSLQTAQAASAAHQNLLLDQNNPPGPAPTDPQGTAGDTATSGAIARRLAEASSSVRSYGAKAAALQSYGQPLQNVGLAILANKYGIMPAEMADQLLRSGNTTRLLPAQVQFRNAGDLGQATDALIASRGQGALDTAKLIYGNTVSGADLAQSDTATIAKNQGDQARANAGFQQQLGGLVSGIGQIGLLGSGVLAGGGNILGLGKTPLTTQVSGPVGGGARIG